MYKFYCVLIMALITYIPRALPMLFVRKKIKNRFINSFLYYTPYAVLTALSLPAMVLCTGNYIIGLIATVAAVAISYFKPNIIIVSISSVAICYILSFFL